MDVRVLRARTFSVLATMSLAGAALVLAGCGGDEGEDSSAAAAAPTPTPTPTPSGTSNRAPTITGAPLTSVMQGTAYAFTPSAADPDGNALTFTITNRPAWATFSSSTGQLSGTPSAADVGTSSSIAISVSDGSASANLASFSIQVVATATGSATLTWNPPTQNTDGTPLGNLTGYRLYWGTAQGSYSNSATLNNPGLSSYVVDQLTPATWYFALTAVNSAGVESDFSSPASKRVL